jgi:MraZ protein
MFLGQFEHTVDEKGRMTIPARFRELLEGGAYVTQGFDSNLIVLPTAAFQQIYQRVNQLSMTDPTTRQLKRLIFSSAPRLEFDKAGRILLPQFLRETAGLDGSAVVVGVGDYFEIWSVQHWADQNNNLRDADANSQRFAALDLSL